MSDRIAVCALTYRRPDGLHRLLQALAAQQFEDDEPVVEIIIVDNDPDQSASELCTQTADDTGLSIRYVHEPTRGIAPARNRALKSVPEDAQWIAFIDDDEVPPPHWLATLRDVQRRWNADVVTGPVIPYFDDPVPDWVEAGGFFAGPRRPTGTRLTHAFTNNVLFRAEVLDDLDRHFDDRLARVLVGEDTHFFLRIARAGRTIVWADEAPVTEWIPAERATPAWLVHRMARIGNAMAHLKLDLRGGAGTVISIAARGIVWIGIGVCQWIAGLALGIGTRVRGRRSIAYGRGLITGLFGRRLEE